MNTKLFAVAMCALVARGLPRARSLALALVCLAILALTVAGKVCATLQQVLLKDVTLSPIQPPPEPVG